MFEFSVALRYLIPRRNQRGVALISLVSILVIALIVWLVLLFFSITTGLEKRWVEKLIAFTAPVRITPTESYYNSYYYLSDSVSALSDYTLKTLKEKQLAPSSDPYDPTLDAEIPAEWPKADRNSDGSLKDPVKSLYSSLDSLNLRAVEFQTALANIRLRTGPSQSNILNFNAYLNSVDEENPRITEAFLAPPASFLDAATIDQGRLHLPPSSAKGEPVLLAKSYLQQGVNWGTRGYISFYLPTTSGLREQRISIYVAGFYDPGMIPLGGRFVTCRDEIISSVAGNSAQVDKALANGLNIQLEDYSDASAVKAKVLKQLQDQGLDTYWTIQTYEEFEFTREILKQLRSDRTLLSLISCIILFVACSNIVSMLYILVNDKRLEIGILAAMGASRRSIASIFAICGTTLGAIGSIIGTALAYITLRNIDAFMHFLSRLQGYELLNSQFYGESLPNELSTYALLLVIVITSLSALLAGLLPALKASRLNPSTVLRSL